MITQLINHVIGLLCHDNSLKLPYYHATCFHLIMFLGIYGENTRTQTKAF
jgi:hypothetical protein